MIYELKFLEVMQNIFSMFHSWFLHFDDETFLKNQNDFDFELLKMNENFVYYWNEITNSRINRKFMTQLHVREIFWNTKSSDSTNNIEMSILRSYDNYISMSTMFYTSSSIFITNIHKKMNFIIYSKFQTIEFRQNNKFNISNRYFS